MLKFKFTYPFYLTERPRQHKYWSTAGALDDSEFSFTTAVKRFHVYRRGWLAKLERNLSTEREPGNNEDRFAFALGEHRSDEDVDDRPIVI